MGAQLLQVHLVAQRRAKSCQRFGRVILLPVETAINQVLDAPAQRMEERGNGECRDDNYERLSSLRGEPPDQAFQPDDQFILLLPHCLQTSLNLLHVPPQMIRHKLFNQPVHRLLTIPDMPAR